MVEISAFRGIRYQPEVVELGSVLCPPYDVIDPELQAELYGRAMQNLVRIEWGRDYPDDVPGQRDRYERARGFLRGWLEQGVLTQDHEPSIYVHRHAFTTPEGSQGERLGCFLGIHPVPYESGQVLRHELTHAAPREDRLRLLRATGAQTSPVLLLHEGATEVTSALAEVTGTLPASAEAVFEGEGGPERHRLWRVSDPSLVESVCAGLARTRLFIADGHHRYQTALDLGLPWVLALVSAIDDPGNVILPTHRVVTGAGTTAAALCAALKARGWRVVSFEDLPRLLDEMADLRERDHAFGLLAGEESILVSRPRELGDAAHPVRSLDVSVLESEILEPLLGVTEDSAAEARLVYTRDPQLALSRARQGAGIGFLVNATQVSEVTAVALAGEAMPQKSTYFFPKVPAGLVMMRLEESGAGD